MPVAHYPGIENEQISNKYIIKVLRKKVTYESIIPL